MLKSFCRGTTGSFMPLTWAKARFPEGCTPGNGWHAGANRALDQPQGLPTWWTSKLKCFYVHRKGFGSISAGWGVFSYVPCIWIYRQERNSFGGKTTRNASIINAFQMLAQITLGRWLGWAYHEGVNLTSKRVGNQHFASFSRKTYSIVHVDKPTQHCELSHITTLKKYISSLVIEIYGLLLLDKKKVEGLFYFFTRFKIRIELKLVIKGETFIILNPSYN